MKNRDLMFKRDIYQSVYQQMLGYEKAYAGGLAFKQSVRRKRPSEDSTLYLDLISNTVAQPICRYIVDTINDVLFEPGVKRKLAFCDSSGNYIDPDNCYWSELFLLDADLNNRSLNSFMEQVGDITSIFGHCWVAVDMPQEQDGNLGRPYAVSISPLNVWDWEFEYYGGRPMLKRVKVVEMETPEAYIIKCYYLGDSANPSGWQQYEVEKNAISSRLDAEAELIAEGTFPPGMSIPLFIAYGRQDPRIIDLGISDIDSAADAQREYYKLECEAYSSIQFAKTLIRADKGVSIPVHAGAIVRAQQGQVETIQVDTGDVARIMDMQKGILEYIEGLTGLGGLRNTRIAASSGIAIVEERKQLHRAAKAKARLMEVTEGMIFTYAARFMDMRWAGSINYNTDYESYDTNYRLALLKQAKDLAGDNELINTLIAKELLGMLTPEEDSAEVEAVYVDSIPNPAIKQLLMDQEQDLVTRDLGDQTPPVEVEDPEVESSGITGDNTTIIGGVGTATQATGVSLYPQQSVAVQLAGLNVGR